MKNYYRTLITEDEKSRILGLHKNKGYKTLNEDFDIEFNTLLSEKVQWRQNDTAPFKFQDHSENIKPLQKALGFPANLQTGNFWVKTEAAVKQKMKELNLGDYTRDAGISQDIFDKIVASPSPTKTTAELQQLQSTTAGSTTQGTTADPAQAKSSDAKLLTTMMKVDVRGAAKNMCYFTVGYDGSAQTAILSKRYKLTVTITDTSTNAVYEAKKDDLEFDSSNYYNNYFIMASDLEPKIDALSAGTTYKLTVKFEDAGSVETTFKISVEEATTNTDQDTSYKIDLGVNTGWTVQQETRSTENKTIGSVSAMDYDYIATNGNMTYAVQTGKEVSAYSNNGTGAGGPNGDGIVNKTNDIVAAKSNVGLSSANPKKETTAATTSGSQQQSL